MNHSKFIAGILLTAALAFLPAVVHADDVTNAVASTNAVVKPYPLNTCLVCGMEMGMMGSPYTFVYQGQEIKVCNKYEKSDFDKNPDKYMKKLASTVAAQKK